MSVYGIIDDTTGKIFDSLIPQGGGIALTKGQLISANAASVEVAVPVGINGTILMADSTQDDGLRWAVVPGALALAQGQLLSADLAGDPTIVPAPVLPAQANYVLSADGTAGALGTNMLWKPITGGGGIIDAIAPLIDDATAGINTISINFGASVGEIPYGTGVAKTGAFTNVPVAGQILGVSNGVPTWIPAGGSGTITATAPLTEYAVGASSNIAIDFVAKGDLVVGSGPQAGGNPIAGVILTAGANDMVLSCNSNTPSGLEWVASGAGSSATIFRNSNDSTPLVITAPTTSNDTCVITADRVFNNSASQIYNVGGAGTQTPSQSFLLYTWTPAINISMTTIVVNLKLEGNGSFGAPIPTNVALTSDPQGLNPIATSDNTGVETAGPYPFINFDNLPFEVVGGTTYYFWVLFQLAQGDQAWNYLNGTPVGDITITGISYPAAGVSTFTCPVGTKFRIPNDLVGKTTATCSSFSSQSFVATGQQSGFIDWVMVGQLSGGVILSP